MSLVKGILVVSTLLWTLSSIHSFSVHEAYCDPTAQQAQYENGTANKPDLPLISVRARRGSGFGKRGRMVFSGFPTAIPNTHHRQEPPSKKRDFEIICSAEYPIEFYNDPVEDENISEPSILQRRWVNDNSRPLESPSRFVIIFHMDLDYIQAKNQTYGCWGVQDPCLRRSWNSWFDPATKKIHFHEWEAGNSSSPPMASVPNFHHHVQKEDCPASFYYEASDISKREGLSRIACRFQDGSNGIIQRHACSSSTTVCLNAYRQQPSVKSNCWVPVLSNLTCPKCNFTTVEVRSFESFVAACERGNDSSVGSSGSSLYSGSEDENDVNPPAGALVILGVPQEHSSDAKFYFDLKDVEASSMIHLDKFTRKFNGFAPASLTLTCSASRFLTATPFRFALEYEGSSELVFPTDQIEENMSLGGLGDRSNYFEAKYDLELMNDNRVLKRVYCFAPLLRSPGWINASIPIEVAVPRDDTEETGEGSDYSSIDMDVHSDEDLLGPMFGLV